MCSSIYAADRWWVMDFRSRGERDREAQRASSEQADYKRMYQEVLAENQAFRTKLDEITASHGELQARFADLLGQFDALKSASQARSDDLLKIARNMEEMVSTAYEQQGQLLSRYQDDLTRRLGSARASLGDLEDER